MYSSGWTSKEKGHESRSNASKRRHEERRASKRTHINSLLPEPRENRVGSSTDRLVLALDDETDLNKTREGSATIIRLRRKGRARRATHGRGSIVVDRVGVSRKRRDDDAGSPGGPLISSLDDPVDERVADSVLDDDAVDDGGGNKEFCGIKMRHKGQREAMFTGGRCRNERFSM